MLMTLNPLCSEISFYQNYIIEVYITVNDSVSPQGFWYFHLVSLLLCVFANHQIEINHDVSKHFFKYFNCYSYETKRDQRRLIDS